MSEITWQEKARQFELEQELYKSYKEIMHDTYRSIPFVSWLQEQLDIGDADAESLVYHYEMWKYL